MEQALRLTQWLIDNINSPNFDDVLRERNNLMYKAQMAKIGIRHKTFSGIEGVRFIDTRIALGYR